MSQVRSHTKKKYEDIRIAFKKFTDKKYKGVQKYTNDYIFIKLGEKFYLSSTTIENVVFHRVGYD